MPFSVTQYPISISQITIHHFLLRRLFLTYITEKDFSDLTISVTLQVSYNNHKLLTLRQFLSSSPMCLVGFLLRIISVSVLCFMYVFSSFCVLFSRTPVSLSILDCTFEFLQRLLVIGQQSVKSVDHLRSLIRLSNYYYVFIRYPCLQVSVLMNDTRTMIQRLKQIRFVQRHTIILVQRFYLQSDAINTN